jgi:cytochrome P450
MPDARVPVGDVDITLPQFVLDPVGGYNRLRSLGPITWQHGARGFLVTQYDLATAVLRAPSLREPDFAAGWHKIGAKLKRDFDASYRFFNYLPFTFDGTTHKRLRSMFAKGIAPFADAVEVFDRRVDSRLATVRRDGGFDLARDFASPLLFDIFCDLMEISEADRADITDLAHLSWALESTLPIRRRDELTATIERCMASLIEMTREKLRRPGRSLLHVIDAGLPPDEEDAVVSTAHLASVMLVMGNDALAGSICFALRQILSEDGHSIADQRRWEDLSDDALRFTASVDFLNRIASEDTAIAGCPFGHGERIVISPLAANHDPAVAGADAGTIRKRPQLGVGLTFGAGAHTCIGARISRNIVRSALRGLSGLPLVRLAGPAHQSAGRVIRTMESMPVRLE